MAKKKQQPTNTNVSIETVKDNVVHARREHDEWWGPKGKAQKSFRYRETDQKPDNFPDGLKYYAQLNIIKENHQANMGILTASKMAWDIYGKSSGEFEQERIKIHRSTLRWIAKEMGLKNIVIEALSDYSLCGMGWLRMYFEKFKFTSMNTMGMIKVERLYPKLVKPDPFGTTNNALGGKYTIYDPIVTREQFQQRWGGHILPDGKEINIEKVFNDIRNKEHFDYGLNEKKTVPSRQRITTVEYDYWRWKKVPLTHPVTGEPIMNDDGKTQAVIPVKEYRIAITAGNEILKDYRNPLMPVETFSKILFANNQLMDTVYSVGNFLELQPMQDLINVMLSMTVNSQARQMNSPILMLSAAAKNIDSMIQDIGGYKFLMYDYPEELREAGIPLSGAVPSRLQHGNMDSGWFQLLNWIMAMSERVQTKEVMKGRKPSGVESGVALNLLQSTAMIPHEYTRSKLENPLRLLGSSIHHLMTKEFTGEMEIPTTSDDDEDQATTINREVPPEALAQLIELAHGEGEKGREAKVRIDMITIRDGDKRLTLKEWTDENESEILSNRVEFEKKFQTLTFVENDITFGDFDVALTIDTVAEQSKAEKMARSQIIMESMNAVNAPMAALDYGLSVSTDPEKEEWLDKVRTESEVWQLGMQEKARLEKEAEEAQKAEEQELQTPGGQNVQ